MKSSLLCSNFRSNSSFTTFFSLELLHYGINQIKSDASLKASIKEKLEELQKTQEDKKSINDGGGLVLLVMRNGSTWWRYNYTVKATGKRKPLSLGVYPQVPLAAARKKAVEAREQVAAGIDPSDLKKQKKTQDKQQQEIKKLIDAGLPVPDSFEFVAREWWEHTKGKWTDGHAQRTITRLINDVFPYLGSAPINTITAINLLDTIRRIEARGAIETAHRTNQACESVFAYAIGTGRCENNPATAIRKVLKPAPPQKNFALVKGAVDISTLLNNIEEYKGTPIIRAALQLIPLTFVRPNELAALEWSHIDFDKALWTVPAHIKKQSAAFKSDPERVHLVPLSKQALAILREIQPLTGNGRYVFPSLRTASGSTQERHITIESLLGALRRKRPAVPPV